jgi:hypothetical protein
LFFFSFFFFFFLPFQILDRLREAEGIAEATPLATQSSSVAAHNSSSLHAPKTLLEQMEDLFEECNEGFVSVASEAIDLLVLQITVTLQKPTGNLFTPSWLKDSSVTDDIILTLQDFADDYKVKTKRYHCDGMQCSGARLGALGWRAPTTLRQFLFSSHFTVIVVRSLPS